jgi:hypothetical protein
VALVHRVPQRLLGELGGRGDEREVVRVRGRDRTRDVDDDEQCAVLGVVDGRRRAGPVVLHAYQVLGGEDLHRVIQRDRRADRVGPGRALRPAHALYEGDGLGHQLHARVPLEPQHVPVGVGDHEHLLGVGGHDPAEHVAQQRYHGGERMARAQLGHVVGGELERRVVVLGVDARVQRPLPRRPDQLAQADRRCAVGQHGRVRPAQHARVALGIGRRVEGIQGSAGTALLSPGRLRPHTAPDRAALEGCGHAHPRHRRPRQGRRRHRRRPAPLRP